MEESKEVESTVNEKKNVDDAEVVKKVLHSVVNKRKTIPTKCMEYLKEAATYELMALENAKVVLTESEEKKNFKKAVQELHQEFKSFHFKGNDLHEAEKKLLASCKKVKEANIYLANKQPCGISSSDKDT